MPFILKVYYRCRSEEIVQTILNCVRTFAQHQLTVPYPKSLVYHFAQTNPENDPLLLEFTELYYDDEVFWAHLANLNDVQTYMSQMFNQDNRTIDGWYAYGTFDEKSMKPALANMGVSFDSHQIGGFVLNTNMSQDALRNPDQFGMFRINVEAKVGQGPEAAEILELIANDIKQDGILTFLPTFNKPKESPEAIEINIVAQKSQFQDLLQKHQDKWRQLGSILAKADGVGFGFKDDNDDVMKTMTDLFRGCSQSKIRARLSHAGYVLHPEAIKAFV